MASQVLLSSRAVSGGSSLTDATRRRSILRTVGRIGAAVNLRYELAIFGAFLAFIAILIAVM